MRQLQLMAHGEPSDVIELNTVSQPALGPEIEEIYQKLRDLVADGSLSAAVEHVYRLDQFKEAFKQSLKSHRTGKILFTFSATDPQRKNLTTV
ncbi:MAG TPA: zinc-binding dehydrogenase [Candidatus Acidoferrales bacterium]|nr:zinc-binding dehydrogenase [Candidatus Acidoferrales bacterium]